MVKHIKLSVCDSTQDELKAHSEDRVLISTEKQSRGRGRGDHQWEHAEGSLAFSFSCAPHPQLTWQSLEVSVLVHQFILKNFGIQLQLKWPNDLYYQNKKCGGILLHHSDKRMHIGIGLNLLAHSKWGGILSDHSLWSQSMCHDIPFEFACFYLSQTPMRVEIIKDYWLNSCFHLSKNVTLSEGNEEHSGLFTGLGPYGEALIDGKSYFNGSLRIKDL
jgi:BirA family transcriptional regulator, biotin operon repressor / biotin---[acetyl-CoA-carboxylase] ligase